MKHAAPNDSLPSSGSSGPDLRDSGSLSPRLSRLPRTVVLGREVRIADDRLARLLGLAYLTGSEAGTGLLIPRCSSIHTLGMRFPLDVVFLDERRRCLSLHRAVPRCRFLWRRGAAAVLELPGGGAALLELATG